MSRKLIMLGEILWVIVCISFSATLIALLLSMAWMTLNSAGLVG
ncbi:hypothetical protein [Escherichia coli]|nr:hypothetical protein [Escherichia coli]EII19468.1 hypothetical protein EC90111_3717 [Escherichia coli 9.0111]EII21358.1 hypothetical protein EC90111_5838 [Escherichia coli 9.0111]MDA6302217.1 hypothetical protein [Escherichia coli]